MKKFFALLVCACVTALVSASTVSAWTWPIEGSVVRAFVLGDDPYATGQHRGIDVAAVLGASVQAPIDGLVSFRGFVPSGGLTLTIETDEGYSVTLQQLAAVSVVKGARVVEGATIGTVGASIDAATTRPHVHLGIRTSSDRHGYVDPLTFLVEPERGAGAPDALRPSAGAAGADERPASLDREIESQRVERPVRRAGAGAADGLAQSAAVAGQDVRPADGRITPEIPEATRPDSQPLPASSPPVEELEGSSAHTIPAQSPLADAPQPVDETLVGEAIETLPSSDAMTEPNQRESAASPSAEQVGEQVGVATGTGVAASASERVEAPHQILGEAESLPLEVAATVGRSTEETPPAGRPPNEAGFEASSASSREVKTEESDARFERDKPVVEQATAGDAEGTVVAPRDVAPVEIAGAGGQVSVPRLLDNRSQATVSERLESRRPSVELSRGIAGVGDQAEPVPDGAYPIPVAGTVAATVAEQPSEAKTRMRSWGHRLVGGGLAVSLILLAFLALAWLRCPRSVVPAMSPDERRGPRAGTKSWRSQSRERCSRRGMSHGHSRRRGIARSGHAKAIERPSRRAATRRGRHGEGRRKTRGRTL
jgi:hypothetical protein